MSTEQIMMPDNVRLDPQNGSDSPRLPLSKHAELVVALMTPCRAVGEVSPDGMRRLTENLSACGCDGLFVLSSTGEMVLIDEDDRRRLVSAAREGAPADVTLFAGIGGVGPKQAARYAKLAQADGADIAVVMAPFFQKLSQAELAAYVERIADESPIPIGIYHHLRMPTAFAVETVARLAAHPNVVACKDTSTDLQRMQQLVEATADCDFPLYQGSESLILESLNLGAHGCISAMAGVAPEWHRDLIAAYRSGDLDQAQAYQNRLLDLMEIFKLSPVKESLAHFVHTLKHSALQRGWIDSTDSLLPGFEPTAAFEEAINEILHGTGLLAESVTSAVDS